MTTINEIPEEELKKSREIFKEFIIKKKLRVTNQRLAIFEAAFNQVEHFTADDLLEKSRKIDRTISRATVYRTLPILTESSLLKEIDIGKDFKYYLLNYNQKTEHAQVICLDCDKIHELDAPFMEWYADSIAQKLGLIPESQRLQVSARCQKLSEQGQCPNLDKRAV